MSALNLWLSETMPIRLADVSRRFDHTQQVMVGATNNVDPDDGNAWVCKACRLPIFFTPFTRIEGSDTRDLVVLHNQCADEQLPPKFEGHPLHPRADLVLMDNNNDEYCDRCHSVCGSKLYKCVDSACDFKLDLTCAVSISVVHRSHAHRLTATRGKRASCSFINCNACGTRHHPPLEATWDLSYVCSICDFWIHPECAVLPNAIVVHKHHKLHPLLLNYRDTEIPTNTIVVVCTICNGKNDGGIGWYDCFHCGYSAHVKCVMDSDLKQVVLVKDAEIPGLLRLPMADQHQGLMARIMKMITSSTTTSDHDTTTGASTSGGSSKDMNKVHEHPLIFHDNLHDDDDDDIDYYINGRVCNACVRLVPPSSPFYSCSSRKNEQVSSCKDFILHDCCARLPWTLVSTRNKKCQGHSLSLVNNPFVLFKTSTHAGSATPYPSNGFSYLCERCNDHQDVVSSLMPVLITHDAHSTSHFLRKLTRRQDAVCSFCAVTIDTSVEIGYECNNACNFFLHAECAILPATVTHEFDRHPLNLIRPSQQQAEAENEEEEGEIPFCEICEKNNIGNHDGRCYYGCDECEQLFHTDCIPYFDHLSKIKFGFTVPVPFHDCPLACVRASSVHGYRCGHCQDVIRESDQIALECAECCFRMHVFDN